jgi:hypothetical protein
MTWQSPLAPLAVTLICGLALGAFPLPASAAAPAGEHDAAWVDAQIKACQPTPEERRFDQIGWLTDIRSAEKLAREHGRPVFLFTHDGHMAIGRC